MAPFISTTPPESTAVVWTQDTTSEDTTSSSSRGASPTSSHPRMKCDANFNAPIKHSFWRRFHDRSWVVLAQLAQLFYLYWRWQRFVTTRSTFIVSLPLIISETLVVVCGSFITYFLIFNQCDRPKLRLSKLGIPREDMPTVDIMIPCYNEPVKIVQNTIFAALSMDYPPEKLTICLLDDGNSCAMMRLLASIKLTMGPSDAKLRYIARRKLPGVPHHAKAGNINNALMCEGTTGDFIVVFDCDMVCHPHFLQAVLPHFYKVKDDALVVDNKVAMVQSPQSFINVSEDDPLGQQYRYFYGPVLKGWDAAGSTPCCGTNVTFSREALLSIGGFTYGSITEDFLTSMSLHAAGYQTKYIHEYLAAGLSPETVHDFYKQRFRWAAGGLQIFVRNNALFKRGLTHTQRFLYFWAGFNTCLSIPMIYVVSCPILNLLGQGYIRIATFDMYEYLVAFCPYMVLQLICMKISYRDVPTTYLRRSLEESAFMLFCYARAFLTVVMGLKLGFKVTSKDGDTSEFRKSFNWCIPMLIYYLLASASMGFGVLTLWKHCRHHQNAPPASVLSVCISMAWLLFVGWQLWPPVGFLLRSLTHRHPTTITTTATTKAMMVMPDDEKDEEEVV